MKHRQGKSMGNPAQYRKEESDPFGYRPSRLGMLERRVERLEQVVGLVLDTESSVQPEDITSEAQGIDRQQPTASAGRFDQDTTLPPKPAPPANDEHNHSDETLRRMEQDQQQAEKNNQEALNRLEALLKGGKKRTASMIIEELGISKSMWNRIRKLASVTWLRHEGESREDRLYYIQ